MALIMRQGNNQFGDIIINDQILFDNWELEENNITNAFEINNNGVNAISIANGTQIVLIDKGVLILGNSLTDPKIDTTGTDIRLSPNTTYEGILTINFLGDLAYDTDKFVIDRSTGFIGISQDTPFALLHIGDSETGELMRFDTENNWYWIQSGSGVGAGLNLVSDVSGKDFSIIDNGSSNQVFTARPSGTSADQRILLCEDGGYVGMGTASPNYPLHLNAEATSVNFQLTTDNTGEFAADGLLIGIDSSSNAFFNNQENAHMDFYTNDNKKLTILNNGNIGIGLDTPLTLLELGDTTPVIRLKDTRTSSGGAADIELGAIEFYNEDDTGIGAGLHARILTGTDNTDAKPEGRITFETYIDNVVSGFMVLDSAGNVGIGNTDPDTKLDVRGDVTIVDGFTLFIGDETTALSDNAFITLASDTDRRLRIGMADNTRPQSYIQFSYTNNQDDSEIGFYITDDNGVSAVETMRILKDGNIAVERTSPITTGASIIGSHTSTVPALEVHRNTGSSSSAVFNVASNVGGTNTIHFIVAADGDATNTNNSYGAISDVKYKENIVDCNSQWEDIKAMRFRNYNMIITPELTQLGVVAQELELTSPSLITNKTKKVKTGKKTKITKKIKDDDGNETEIEEEIDEEVDEDYKCVKASVMYMKGMVALQEALLRIEVLEQKLINNNIN